MLSLRNACALPWGREVLCDVNLDVNPGEIVAVLGPNGAGKSSLLHVIAGGLALSRGAVTLGERGLASWSSRDRARAIALLPQRSTLAFPFSVFDVVLLGRIPHASGQRADAAICHAAMRALDVSDLATRRYTQLSGGEQQRVQIARVLAQLWRGDDSAHRVLLLDEPGSALDLAHLELLSSTLQQFAASGCAVLFVAHDFNFAGALADRAVFLKSGRIATQGTVGDVFTSEVFEEVFAVSPLVTPHPQNGRPLVFAR